MRTLLVGALIANLVGCSHQPPPAQTAAADSCASRNPLACLMSVRVSLAPTSLTTNSATPESRPAIARTARETAALSRPAKQRLQADRENVSGTPRHGSIMAAQ